MLPALSESMQVVRMREPRTGLLIPLCPNEAWATLVHPDLEPADALGRLMGKLATCAVSMSRIPIAAWRQRWPCSSAGREAHRAAPRRAALRGPRDRPADRAAALQPLDRRRLRDRRRDRLPAEPPTEEVFTTPDPERVSGTVAATKPLFTAGTTITGLKVTFEAGRVVSIEADEGAEVLRGMTEIDDGAARLGEVALVDREGRIGPLGTVFYDTLLDENAASHIAFGQGYLQGVNSEDEHARINRPTIHTDFMIGGQRGGGHRHGRRWPPDPAAA